MKGKTSVKYVFKYKEADVFHVPVKSYVVCSWLRLPGVVHTPLAVGLHIQKTSVSRDAQNNSNDKINATFKKKTPFIRSISI